MVGSVMSVNILFGALACLLVGMVSIIIFVSIEREAKEHDALCVRSDMVPRGLNECVSGDGKVYIVETKKVLVPKL